MNKKKQDKDKSRKVSFTLKIHFTYTNVAPELVHNSTWIHRVLAGYSKVPFSQRLLMPIKSTFQHAERQYLAYRPRHVHPRLLDRLLVSPPNSHRLRVGPLVSSSTNLCYHRPLMVTACITSRTSFFDCCLATENGGSIASAVRIWTRKNIHESPF